MPDFMDGVSAPADALVATETGGRKGMFSLAYYREADLVKDGYGLNALGQEEEVADYRWIYDVKVDTDGMKLIQQYMAQESIEESPGALDDKIDLIVYHEKATTAMGLNITCLVSLSKAFRARIKEMAGKESKKPEEWLLDKFVEIYKRDGLEKKYGTTLDEDALEDAIAYELSIQESRDDFRKVLSQFMPAFLVPRLSPREALMKGFHSLAETLRQNKMGEAVWNPEHKPYTPIIADIEEYDAFLKLWQNKKNEVEAYVKNIEQVNGFIQQVPLISQLHPDDVAAQVKNVCAGLRHVLDYMDTVILGLKVYGELIKLENAFLAGFINGVVELFAGLLDLLAILIGLDDLVERAKILESLENFFGRLFTKPQEIGDAIVAGFDDFVARYADKSGYERAFHAGEDLLGAIDFIVAVVSVVRLLKSVPALFKKFDDFVTGLNKAKQTADNLADDTIPPRSALSREVETQQLLEEAKLPGAGAKGKYAVGKFKEYGLSLSREDDIFKIVYKEQILWSGNKEALAKFWGVLDRKYSGNVSKWLDELLTVEILKDYKRLRGGYLKITKEELLKLWEERIISNEIGMGDIDQFMTLRQAHPELEDLGANMASMLGKYKNGDEMVLIAHSGRKKIIPRTMETPKSPEWKTYKDYDKSYLDRMNDSENKLMQFLYTNYSKVNANDIESIVIKTIFEPCESCKREILIFQEKFGIKIELFYPNGIKTNDDLMEFIKK